MLFQTVCSVLFSVIPFITKDMRDPDWLMKISNLSVQVLISNIVSTPTEGTLTTANKCQIICVNSFDFY